MAVIGRVEGEGMGREEDGEVEGGRGGEGEQRKG
jgi:hypothetical protein